MTTSKDAVEPLDFSDVVTYSIKDRKSKVQRRDFARPWKAGSSFSAFLESIPNILAGGDLRKVVSSVLRATSLRKPVIWGMGAHVIKCGLNPVITALLKDRVITTLVLNGAGIIHDFELAYAGATSEDVPKALGTRSFGMARETAAFLNQAIQTAQDEGVGLGFAVGRALAGSDFPYKDESLLAQAYELGIPVTVHVAIGGDIIHMHPGTSGEAIGAASFHDFRVLCRLMTEVGDGGVIFNVGSAVVLPVVFEKAIAVARNLGHDVARFTGVTLDFLSHYRSGLNPVRRAIDLDGEGYSIIGHHELLIPLLAAAIKEGLALSDTGSVTPSWDAAEVAGSLVTEDHP